MSDIKAADWEKLLRNEIKEVVGCTEPASIAYAVARAREALREKAVEEVTLEDFKVELSLSRDVDRNVSTVNVPVIRKKGARSAAAAGLFARPDSLNLFPSLDAGAQAKVHERLETRGWFDKQALDRRGIYVEATCETDGHRSRAVVSGEHDRIEQLSCDGETLETAREQQLPEIKGLEHAQKLVENDDGSLARVVREYLNGQGKIWEREEFDDSLEAVEEVIRGRMAGDALRIQTITGSGNQGIFLALPLYEQFRRRGEEFLPAALFAVLVQIHLVQQEKRISDLCGLTARAGRSLLAGFLYDQGRDLAEIEAEMDRLAESMRGVACEGAKASCALKGYMALNMVNRLSEG